MLEIQVRETREKVYGVMTDRFYGMLKQYIYKSKPLTAADFQLLGPCNLVFFLLGRIQEGHAVIEQKGSSWFFWFSGTRPYYEESPFPFRKGIVLSRMMDKGGWWRAYAYARHFAKAFGVQLYIHKERKPRLSPIQYNPFLEILPLPA